MDKITAKELANILSVGVRTIQRKAKVGDWPFEALTQRGGEIPHYLVDFLPEDIQQNIATYVHKNNSPVDHFISLDNAKEDQQKAQKQTALLNEPNLINDPKVLALLTIIQAANKFHELNNFTKDKAYTLFCEQYNSRTLVIESSVYDVKATISRATLFRWDTSYKTQGISGLKPKAGLHRKGASVIDCTPEIKQLILALLEDKPHIKYKRIKEAIEMRFCGQFKTPSESAIRAWVENWKQENASLWLRTTDPDGWKNKHMVAFGNMSAAAKFINHIWEFDSTPTDVMLTDGRYSIIGVLDIFTRRVKCILHPTSNSEAIALLMREAVIDWGVPTIARTDNGKDYVSVRTKLVFDALDIQQDITNPYSGDEKPFIERFFRTFSHDLAELLDGYIGHNVSERQKIEARHSFADRLMEKKTKGKDQIGIDVNLSKEKFESFLNQWIEGVYHTRVHSTLKCSPNEKYNSHIQKIKRLDNVHTLDLLLAEVPTGKGLRKVTKEGIKIGNTYYVAKELATLVGQQVACRYDPKDIGRVFVFSIRENSFVCEAIDPALAGNDFDLVSLSKEARKLQRAALSVGKRKLIKATKQQSVKNIANELLEHHSAPYRNINNLPKSSVTHSTAMINAAHAALNQKQKTAPTLSSENFQILRQEQLKMDKAKEIADNAKPRFSSEFEEYAYLLKQQTKRQMTDEELSTLSKFETSNPAATARAKKLILPVSTDLKKQK